MSNRLVPMYRRNIGIVFQDFRLLQKKTVYENVAFAMEAVHQKRKLIKKQVPHILKLVGISEKARQVSARAVRRRAAESCYCPGYRKQS